MMPGGDPYGEALAAPFVTVEPKPVPAELQGTWTGKQAFYLNTYRLNADGTGLICMSPSPAGGPLFKAKYDGSALLFQGGGKVYLQAEGANRLVVDYRTFGTQPTIFVRDEQLGEAAIECQKAMMVD